MGKNAIWRICKYAREKATPAKIFIPWHHFSPTRTSGLWYTLKVSRG